MKRKRFTEQQIVRILKEHKAGVSVRDLIRKHGVSEQSFYRWKKQYGGMEEVQVKELKALREENRQLKEMVAEISLENKVLRDINSKNW